MIHKQHEPCIYYSCIIRTSVINQKPTGAPTYVECCNYHRLNWRHHKQPGSVSILKQTTLDIKTTALSFISIARSPSRLPYIYLPPGVFIIAPIPSFTLIHSPPPPPSYRRPYFIWIYYLTQQFLIPPSKCTQWAFCRHPVEYLVQISVAHLKGVSCLLERSNSETWRGVMQCARWKVFYNGARQNGPLLHHLPVATILNKCNIPVHCFNTTLQSPPTQNTYLTQH